MHFLAKTAFGVCLSGDQATGDSPLTVHCHTQPEVNGPQGFPTQIKAPADQGGLQLARPEWPWGLINWTPS